MALNYNYQAFLEVDDETYTAWTPKLERLEQQALSDIKAANPSYNIDENADTVQTYIEELAVVLFYGDSLSTQLFDYHMNRLASLQEKIRYTKGG